MFSVTAVCFVLGFVFLASGQESIEYYKNECQGRDNDTRVLELGNKCKSFYTCWEGEARGPQDCAEGTIFSNGECRFEEKVQCGDMTRRSFDCRNGVNPQNCSEFFRCADKKEYKFLCLNAVYSENSRTCVWKYQLTDVEKQLCIM